MNTRIEEDTQHLVDALNFKQKVDRSLELVRGMHEKYGDRMVVANSLGKDSMAVWDLCKRVDPKMRGFIVTTRFKPKETRAFQQVIVKQYPQLQVFESDAEIPDDLYQTDPDQCCEILKVEPAQRALREMKADCWVTGRRCTEGSTRKDLSEFEVAESGLVKVDPILLWDEREVWQYLALYRVPVNPLYGQGYRSLGCQPCTGISSSGEDERSGRWFGTDKIGGECGIHTRDMRTKQAESATD